MEKIGLLAGIGRLPVECAKAAKALGYEVYAVALLPETDPELSDCTADCASISIAQLERVLEYLKEKGVQKVTMLGKVTKELLFNGQHAQPDARMMQLIMSLPHGEATFYSQAIFECAIAAIVCIIDMIIGIAGEWLCQIPPIDGPESPKMKTATQRNRYAAAATKSATQSKV